MKIRLKELEIYKNSTPIKIFKENLTISDIVKIALIGKLNILLIGERGEGKTKLLEEINHLYFDDKGIYIRARPDMKLREIFERFNIEKFNFELKEIKSAPFTIIDEINRAPPLIQNEFFHILDGFIEFENKRISLGNGYHIVFATANFEPEEEIRRYHGIFEMDLAILDRFNIIINVDYFPPTPLDTLEIALEINSSRRNGADNKKSRDFSDLFKKSYSQIKKIPFTLDAIIFLLYLRHGLEWCERTPFHSKRAVLSNIPLICEGCHYLGNGCGYILPPSMRFLKSLILFSKAKAFYLKKKEIDYEDLLEDFSFLSCFNGLYNRTFVEENHSGNYVKASLSVKHSIKKEMEEKKEKLKEVFIDALKGKSVKSISGIFDDRWNFIKDLVKSISDIAKREGDLLKKMKESKEEFKKIALKTKNPLLLFMLKDD